MRKVSRWVNPGAHAGAGQPASSWVTAPSHCPQIPCWAPCWAIIVKMRYSSCQQRLSTDFRNVIEAEWRIYASVNLTIIGSDNGLSPGRRQAIIWTNAWILLIRTLGTNFSEILSEIHIFSFTKIHLKMSSGKRRPFCLCLNVLTPPFKGLGKDDFKTRWGSFEVWDLVRLILEDFTVCWPGVYMFWYQRHICYCSIVITKLIKGCKMSTIMSRSLDVFDKNMGNLGQNGWHFADDIFRHIFLNKDIKISLKFVRCKIDNMSELVPVMAWHWTGDKPLPAPVYWPNSWAHYCANSTVSLNDNNQCRLFIDITIHGDVNKQSTLIIV